MRIIGKNIMIRDLSMKDLDDFYEYASDPLVGPNAGWKPVPSKTIAKNVLTSRIVSKEVYAIALKEDGKLIGTISLYHNGLRPYKFIRQLGFSIGSKYFNLGYTTEACKLIIDYIFKHTDCDLIEVGHHSNNIPSKRVIEKSGFRYDGRLRKYKKLFDGRLVDADFYSMTREDYERLKENERIKNEI